MEINTLLKQQPVNLGHQVDRLNKKGDTQSQAIKNPTSTLLSSTDLLNILQNTKTALSGNSSAINNNNIDKPQLKTTSNQPISQSEAKQLLETIANPTIDYGTLVSFNHKMDDKASQYKTLTQSLENCLKGSDPQALDAAQKKAQEFASSLHPQQLRLMDANYQHGNSTKVNMSFLFAVMGNLLNEDANTKLSVQSDLHQLLTQYNESTLEKFQDFIQAMGGSSEIIGWIMAAVGVAASPFTSGASLVLAFSGVSLAVGEKITSINDMIKPLTDEVMKFINYIADEITQGLIKAGVDPDTARTLGDAISSTLVVATLIGVTAAGVALGESSALSVFEKTVILNLVKESLQKLISDVDTNLKDYLPPEVMKNLEGILHSLGDKAYDMLVALLNSIVPQFSSNLHANLENSSAVLKSLQAPQTNNAYISQQMSAFRAG